MVSIWKVNQISFNSLTLLLPYFKVSDSNLMVNIKMYFKVYRIISMLIFK